MLDPKFSCDMPDLKSTWNSDQPAVIGVAVAAAAAATGPVAERRIAASGSSSSANHSTHVRSWQLRVK